jgi:dihydrolipoyl dehydrogenase
MTSTQIAVIGAGPGGYAAAYLAADLGRTVTMIDVEPNPGGVCTYRGCIPSKALLHVAKLIEESKQAAAWGVGFAAPQIDLDRLRGWKNDVVTKLTTGNGQVGRMRKVNYIQGRAEIVDPQTLRVARAGGGTEEVRADFIVLATGSRPSVIPSLALESERVLDSTSALELKRIPTSLLVVGGGYIGLELGSVYAALGSEVSVVEMTGGLLPGADRDLVNVLAKRIGQITSAVMLNTKVVGMAEAHDGIRVTFDGPGISAREQLFDAVLVSIGRRPNSNIPGLDRTKVVVNARGFIDVDLQRRTAEPSIFAIGDVAGEPMLAHKAMAEGRVAAEAMAGEKTAFEPRAIPAVVFTDPELAWCGVTEQEAQAAGLPFEVVKYVWGASGRAVTLDRTDGLTKLIVEPKSGRVLGVGIVGVSAGEMIAEGVLAIEMGANTRDLALTIHTHPTLSETVGEAAEMFFGHATHVYKPRRRQASP